jgi:hypothetical protein
MTRTIASALVLGAALVFTGCESTQDADMNANVSAGMLNDACPLSGGPVNPDANTAAYDGGTVGFCCNGCASKWDTMTDSDRAAKMAALSN